MKIEVMTFDVGTSFFAQVGNVQSSVNDFISDKKVIDIKTDVATVLVPDRISGTVSGKTKLIYTIMYEENTEGNNAGF